MDATLWSLTPLFFLTALVYSMAGFGGGSTYLALLALFGLPHTVIPKIALICNLVVVTGSLYYFSKTRQLSLKHVLPFALTSIPFAYVGGWIPLSEGVFLLILGFSLGIAGLRLLFLQKTFQRSHEMGWKSIWGIGLFVGALLGFVSGLVGIGGGIFLSPLLFFLGWGNARQIAASSSFFIFVNSLAGLWGHWAKEGLLIGIEDFIPLILAVFLGGQIGCRLSMDWISLKGLQKVTAVIILFVSMRIFWMALI
ncbi:MAG: hypothetical protein A3I75_03740 [Deltaproteobacteria bacterium RIFCSPLOWO2_02_FULL_50_16]|nr:MAG: hypothetical protein A3I75_03740 [Deltaproteobacteria bacterium RIFCSPLOWO2_02_FULL_50_16]OGQ67504.1 MAG: hypothetical protein A3F89_04395 [Deltaproteobacteria bacterium RIFCSPLOWO2_12_FULL_50_11]